MSTACEPNHGMSWIVGLVMLAFVAYWAWDEGVRKVYDYFKGFIKTFFMLAMFIACSNFAIDHHTSHMIGWIAKAKTSNLSGTDISSLTNVVIALIVGLYIPMLSSVFRRNDNAVPPPVPPPVVATVTRKN
jgi:hypothetical protein